MLLIAGVETDPGPNDLMKQALLDRELIRLPCQICIYDLVDDDSKTNTINLTSAKYLCEQFRVKTCSAITHSI